MAPIDPHSYTDDQQPLTGSIDLKLNISFSQKTISGTVQLHLRAAATGVLDLDTNDVTIEDVVDKNGAAVPWNLQPPQPVLGSRLRLSLTGDSVTIRFKTSPSASALQWLEPSQTAGNKQPYIFTQCQPIHARSIFPCQDTPAARIKYTAAVTVPLDTHVVMSASQVSREEVGDQAVELFVMEQPIPTYLFALAAGDIASKDLGPRSRVYAEPAILESAAYEFANTESVISKAEELFGPYEWERFDMLVMPPSFPYGGMENPRMAFLTPTLIVGDRSLVTVVYHELAHSWTGNLVTNATMNDFWLNEGFTVWAERRIVEVLEGPKYLSLVDGIGWGMLTKELARFSATPQFTKLHNDLQGVDPDDVFSSVPYEKGYLFLKRIEQAVGRATFDAFLRKYIETFRFRSIDTATFRTFLTQQLPGIDKEVDLQTWLEEPGIPADAPKPASELLDKITALASGFATGVRLNPADTKDWHAREWQVYLDTIPKKIFEDDVKELEDQFGFSKSKNAEISVAFLTIAAHSGYKELFPAMSEFLHKVGRMKYLRPLYSGLCQSHPEAKEFAKKTFQSAKPKYHPVAQNVIEGIVNSAT